MTMLVLSVSLICFIVEIENEGLRGDGCQLNKISGNDIEQTANTYNLNPCNEALIKASKPNLSN